MREIGEILAYCNLGVFVLLVSLGIAIIRSKDYITAVINMSMFSVLSDLAFLIFGAPDVAITEAAINACLGGVILLGAGKILGFDAGKSQLDSSWIFMIIPVSGACLLCATLPPLGLSNAATDAILYTQTTAHIIGIRNVVTAVLASFRGYDTLWETVVVLSAGVAVLTILRKDDAA